jgi:hypothetical protein
MAIQCEFIDLIIPIDKIDSVYTGGFRKFKEDHIQGFLCGRLYHDNYLFRDGAMSSTDIGSLVRKWEALGLKGRMEIDSKKQWGDFCVVEGMFGGSTLACTWLEYDRDNNSVYLKDKAKGELIGSK